MAVLFNIGSITINTASAWALASGTSQTTANATVATTTSYAFSSTTIATAVTCQNLIMQMYAGGTEGTISVCVSTDGVNATTSCTINASELPQVTAGTYYTYVMFKMDATYGAGTYYVGVKHSAGGSGGTFYRNTTGTNNFYRYHIASAASTTRGAGDYLIICGAAASAGLSTYTVTMANDVANEFNWSTIAHGGILSAPTAATSAFAIGNGGGLNIWNGGELRLGNAAAPVETGNTATFQVTCTSATQYGVHVYGGGKFTTCGSSRTAGKSVTWSYLTTDANDTDEHVHVNDDTGWLSGDTIVIAPTSRTYSEYDSKALTTGGSATLTFTGSGLTYDHSGTSPTQAEVILLNRNVIITPKTLNDNNTTYIVANVGSIISCKWTEFRYLGSNSSGYYGVTSYAVDSVFDSCSFHHMDSTNRTGLTLGLSIAVGSSTVSNCTFYACAYGIRSLVAAATTITDCVAIYSATSTSYGFYVIDGTYTSLDGCRASGFRTDGISQYAVAGVTDCVSHSNTGIGISTTGQGVLFSNPIAWRNGSYGLQIVNSSVTGGTLFGNTTANIYLLSVTTVSCTFSSIIIDSDAAYSTTYAISTNVPTILDCVFSACTIGKTTAHDTAVLNCAAATITKWEIIFDKCGIGEADNKIINSQASLSATSYIGFSKFDGDANDYRTYTKYGLSQSEMTVFNTAAPSFKMTPLAAATTLDSQTFKVAVNDDDTITPSVFIYKSAGYNGAAPDLRIKANTALGIVDARLSNTGAGSESFGEVTGTSAAVDGDGTVELYVRCGGAGYTTGYICVDDFTVT